MHRHNQSDRSGQLATSINTAATSSTRGATWRPQKNKVMKAWGFSASITITSTITFNITSTIISTVTSTNTSSIMSTITSTTMSSSSILPVSVQGEAALPAVLSADSEESGVLLWTLSAEDPQKQRTVHQLHTC
ncbi:hypothetical protein L3Q82_021160 [Scortum barcoo]|uniref:Uncharacterized protein n=1 Tax=Scortum barcoo TaxID=214431 RepID=A0ACB8X3Q5_9TELE|nr:hypothetical protein L3Q82_021160 [Scortum barcoo]